MAAAHFGRSTGGEKSQYQADAGRATHTRPSPTQARLYLQVADALKESLASFPANEAQSIARKGLVVQSLMRLKQICNHSCQFTGQGDYAAKDSGKFQRLEELCAEMSSRQERVLVFTQFQEIIAPLFAHLENIFGRPGLALHGKTAVKKSRIGHGFSAF